jgi:nicotinamide-nucleotide amidase
VAVADTGPEIEQAVREALGRADLIITTGGLGPTSDDITRDLIARLLGTSLRQDETAAANIQKFFEDRKRPMPEKILVQAQVPQGALVLQNSAGLAPGVVLEVKPNPFRPNREPSWLIMLPGPPRELRPMFKDSVQPLLPRMLPLQNPFRCLTLRTVGIGESALQEKIHAPLSFLAGRGLEVGYCARIGQVDLRLAGEGPQARELVSEAEKIVRELLPSHIFGIEDDDLESVIVKSLTARGQSLALAESCTGGCIAHRLTNVPGASAVFLAGIVSYSNDAKQKFLRVRAETLAQHGAVSRETAREMADGAKTEARSDYGLSVTGIAGPSGGTPAKPVGTVFIGLAGPFETVVLHSFNPYDRESFKQVTAHQALDLLRQKLQKLS